MSQHSGEQKVDVVYVAPDGTTTSYFSKATGNIVVKLKSGDNIRPPGGNSTNNT